MSDTKIIEIFEFYLQAIQLKTLPRRGWLQRQIFPAESVADHVWGVSLLSLLLSRELGLNIEKTLKMAVIHELCEAKIGDITPLDPISPIEKQNLELEATSQLLADIDPQGELLEIWKDFEMERTEEGKLVKELDRLEMAFQALYYEQTRGICLEEFFQFTAQKIRTPQLKTIFEALQQKRPSIS